jgi:hypothetical protein
MNEIIVAEFDTQGRALDSNGNIIVLINNGLHQVLKRDTDNDTDKLVVVVESIND